MRSKRMRLIYNPYAGRRRLISQLDTVIQILQDSGHEVSIHRAASPGDIEQVSARSQDVECLVIAGGDGSINQAVNGLLKIPSGQRPVLGILPTGTANDLAYALHLPKSVPEACQVLAKGRVLEMDAGLLNERYFVNVACAGLLTDVSPTVDIKVKNSLGQLAYYLKGLETLPSYRPFHVEFRHEERLYSEDILLFLALNGISAGGMRKLVPKASLTDGLLDIVLIRQSGWPETLSLLLGLLRGDKLKVSEQILMFQTKELSIATDRFLNSDLDGEWGPKSPWVIRTGPKISVLY